MLRSSFFFFCFEKEKNNVYTPHITRLLCGAAVDRVCAGQCRGIFPRDSRRTNLWYTYLYSRYELVLCIISYTCRVTENARRGRPTDHPSAAAAAGPPTTGDARDLYINERRVMFWQAIFCVHPVVPSQCRLVQREFLRLCCIMRVLWPRAYGMKPYYTYRGPTKRFSKATFLGGRTAFFPRPASRGNWRAHNIVSYAVYETCPARLYVYAYLYIAIKYSARARRPYPPRSRNSDGPKIKRNRPPNRGIPAAAKRLDHAYPRMKIDTSRQWRQTRHRKSRFFCQNRVTTPPSAWIVRGCCGGRRTNGFRRNPE